MTAAVGAAGVSKRYGDTLALDAVSLEVDAGEVFALVGPNGAGKTTLVRTLTGTGEPDAGSVSVLGQPPTEIDEARIGLLPQSFGPPERLTARELLDYYAGLYDEVRSVESVLSDVGLSEVAETWYTNLSGGQQRRVCVGIALINDPEVLFLDEPTTGIDPAGRQSVWALLTNLAKSGTTIFLTTHDMSEAATLADRVAFLDSGELIEQGSPETLLETYGGETQLRVETNDPRARAATEFLGDGIEVLESGLRIPNVTPKEIGPIITELEEKGIEYETIAWTEPTLEDAYLEITGQQNDERVNFPVNVPSVRDQVRDQ